MFSGAWFTSSLSNMPKAIYTGDPKAENQTLGNMLGIFSDYHREAALDALACYLHNEGHALQGNKAESDEQWLAKIILRDRVQRHADNWEQATPVEREEALHLARLAIRNLPHLCERIATRYINAAAGVRSMWELARAQREVNMHISAPVDDKRP